MKYHNVILTAITILLILILVKLVQFESLAGNFSNQYQEVSASNQGLIQSIQLLEQSISGLRKKIDDFSERFQKK